MKTVLQLTSFSLSMWYFPAAAACVGERVRVSGSAFMVAAAGKQRRPDCCCMAGKQTCSRWL